MKAKTLWISDLDGTLLNKERKISDYTKNVLNEATSKGLQFSIATARTPATVVDLLEGVHISAPIVVMNGAAIYNMETNTYEKVNYLGAEMTEIIQKVLKEKNKSCFTYCIEDDHLFAYHGELKLKQERAFYDGRQNNPRKTFKQEAVLRKDSVIYFIMMGQKEEIESIYNTLKGYKEINQAYYEDIYEEGIYYLEIFSHTVSKAKGIETLKQKYGYEKVICFGDNYNDVEMFEQADEGYAVENAVEKIKELSTGVIGHHDDAGVARFIEANWQKY